MGRADEAGKNKLKDWDVTEFEFSEGDTLPYLPQVRQPPPFALVSFSSLTHHHIDCQRSDLCANHQLSFSWHCANLPLHCTVLHCVNLYPDKSPLCPCRPGPYLWKLAACFNCGWKASSWLLATLATQSCVASLNAPTFDLYWTLTGLVRLLVLLWKNLKRRLFGSLILV